VGGARLESTDLSVVSRPEADATWLPPGGSTPVDLNPGEADVDFSQTDVLPSIGLEYKWNEGTLLRGSFSKTVARQTFKEVSPILQQEFLGGPIFIGNPELDMAALENVDLRFDYAPSDGTLISLSWFHKNITDPIEYVQRVSTFSYTTAVNYPRGTMDGFELEVRQDLGQWMVGLEGLSVGVNGTLIDSDVKLSAEEIAGFQLPGIQVPLTHRPMTNAPEHLYNVFLTYDWRDSGTQAGLFYTIQGDTLLSGAGQANGNFVPSIYGIEYATLNLSFSQKLNDHFTLKVQAKNLTNPRVTEVYRSDSTGEDVVHASYTKGIDYSIGVSAKFSF
jgi:TonB-dependent receptor